MEFSKIISDMQILQEKNKLYEDKCNKIDSIINSLKKDLIKLEKRKEKEVNEINKTILNLKLLLIKDIINKLDFN